MRTMHIFPNGQTEVGTGEPGYRWVQAYSEVAEAGYSNPVTLSNLRGMAKRDGCKIKMHDDERAARQAFNESNRL